VSPSPKEKRARLELHLLEAKERRREMHRSIECGHPSPRCAILLHHLNEKKSWNDVVDFIGDSLEALEIRKSLEDSKFLEWVLSL
jgi:hypothetical protein